jgi:hypothetical protein
MLIAVLAIALLIGAASAALLSYYGKLKSNVTILQSVLLDDHDYTIIEEDFDAVGGDVICRYHWLRNRASVSIPVQLVSGYPPEVTSVKYYAMGTSETWHVPADLLDVNVFNNVEAYVTKTDKAASVEFKVKIVPDSDHYGMGIAISTDVSTIDFQVWYREYEEPKGWCYQEYVEGDGWTGTVVWLADSGTGITATGDYTGKVFTVDIPIGLLGGCGAQYYFAIQFRTTLLGTLPSGLDLWAQTDASGFAARAVGTEISEATPFDLEPGVLHFYICYEFEPNAVGSITVYTEVRPA